MKRIIFFIIIFIANFAFAGISENSARLEKLRLTAIENPSEQNDLAYLDAFPKTFDKFYFTFYGKKCCEELYDTHIEHLDLLWSLSKKYPKRVLKIWFGVSTNGHWDADAVGFLQSQLAKYAAMETQDFALDLNKKSKNQRESIIRFLADVENHLYYDDYRIASENLKKLGYEDLYLEFERAKTRRMNIKGH